MRSCTTTSSSRATLVLAVLATAACARAPPRVAAPAAPSAPAPPATARTATNGHLRAGIVSVRVTGQDWNWRAPWEKQAPWTRTVTGLVVPGQRILVASTAFGNHLLVEAQKLGSEARSVARVELVDQEGPLALVAVDDPEFWHGLEPLPLAERAPAEGDVTILRWQRSGLLDSYPGTLRQVRSGRHGLSQTSLLTLEVGASTDGLGESEVVVAKGRVAGLVTGRSGDAYAALASAAVVTVPAADGGYVLIGERGHHPPLFAGVPWSTSAVLEQTRAICAAQQLPYAEIGHWEDVDDATALLRLIQRAPTLAVSAYAAGILRNYGITG